MRLAVIAALAIVLSDARLIGNTGHTNCPEDFSKRLASVSQWSALYSLYKLCPDDGEYGEGLSNTVVVTLANHWSDLPALDKLVARDSNFRRLVFRHIDATTDEKDLRRVLNNAETKCPAGLARLCRDIAVAAKAAIADL